MNLLRGKGPVLEIGHRGAAALAPANTIQAVEAALAHGVNLVELDVFGRPDRTLVLGHSRKELGEEPVTLEDVFAFLAGAKPEVGLLADLKRRGMLNETLVVWATEFGRTPGAENADGRDHHPYGFSVWLAGGGIKGGTVHGATDELGFHAVQDRHYVTDLHATVLHQLGLDPRKLEVPGRKRLEIDYGHPITAILS